SPAVQDRRPADERPDVRVEAAELLLQREEVARIRDGCIDLLAVADDAGILHEPSHRACVEARDLRGIEARERAPVIFALAQDSPPAQARLCALQQEELEVLPIVANRHAPLGVVVKLVHGIDALAPRTTTNVGVWHERASVPGAARDKGTEVRAESE